MKQRITPEQLRELTDEQLKKLHTLWKPELGDYMTDFEIEEDGSYFVGVCKYIKSGVTESPGYPLLNIGQMIELLQEKGHDSFGKYYIKFGHPKTKDLCDALWQAVKKIL